MSELLPDGSYREVGSIYHNVEIDHDVLNGANMGRFMQESITDTGLLLAIFNKLYGFSIGLNGYCIYWSKRYEEGVIRWKLDTWKITLVQEAKEQEDQ